MREDEAPKPAFERRPVGHIGLERSAAAIQEVIPDMGRAVERQDLSGGAGGLCLPGAFNGAEGHAHLCLARRRREFLDRLTLSVPAEKVHARVGAGRIALQRLLDQADRLEEVLPVER